MGKNNILKTMYEAENFTKLIGFKVVNVEEVKDEDGNEEVMLYLQNDFGVSIDFLIGEEAMSNEPHIKDM